MELVFFALKCEDVNNSAEVLHIVLCGGAHIDHDGMTSVGSTSNSGADAVLTGKDIHEFPLTLIAPLRAENNVDDTTSGLAGGGLDHLFGTDRDGKPKLIHRHNIANIQAKCVLRRIYVVLTLLSKCHRQSLLYDATQELRCCLQINAEEWVPTKEPAIKTAAVQTMMVGAIRWLVDLVDAPDDEKGKKCGDSANGQSNSLGFTIPFH